MEVTKAAEDILNNPRFEGAIDTIKGVTQWTDVGFATVITFVAFMIICVAMLKNVLAGAYCAYPKFWDHVNEAHKNKQGKGLIQQTVSMFQGGLQGVTGGTGGGGQSIGDIIYGIIPDVKHMTDFEEGEFSAKHYFMKAIPQMLVCVALGAFIYNGTYRDLAALWVNTGTTLINRTLLEFDPIAMFDNFTGTAGRPVFGSDNGVDQYTRQQNAIATSLYTQVIGTYKDIKSAEQKRLLADACDQEAKNILNNLLATDYGTLLVTVGDTQDTPFTMKYSSTWASKDMSADCAAKCGLVKKNPTTYQFAWSTDVATLGGYSLESFTSEVHTAATHIVQVLVYTEGTPDANSGSASDLVLQLEAHETGMRFTCDGTVATAPVLGWKYTQVSSQLGNNTRTAKAEDGTTATIEVLAGTDNSTSSLKVASGAEGLYKLDSPISVTTTVGGVKETHYISYIELGSSSGNIYSKDVNDFSFTVTSQPDETYAKTFQAQDKD